MSNLNKRFIAIAAISIIIFLVVFVGKNVQTDAESIQTAGIISNAVSNDYDRVNYTYEEIIQRCTNIVEVTYEEAVNIDGLDELKFAINNQIKGSISDSVIYVQDSYNLNAEFKKNKTYILFLEKNISLYYTHDRYVMIEGKPSEKVDIDYVQDILSSSKIATPEKYGYNYTESAEMDDILAVSANIFEVEVLDVYVKSKYAPTTVYNCQVKRTLRNEPESAQILIVFFNDTVKKGENYIVLLADTQGPSKIYTLSSKNSVYTINEAEKSPEISTLLVSAKEYTVESEISDRTIYEAEQEYKDKDTN
jgi:hypothetical protein